MTFSLDISTKDNLRKVDDLLRRMKGSHVKVGVLRGTGEHPSADGGQTVAAIAAWNEFGTDTIPARPFLRTTLRENGYYRQALLDALKAGLVHQANMGRALQLVGIRAAADIRNTIDTNDFAPNAPATIRRKSTDADKGNKDKPLIDTGLLRQSIQSELERST
jgi:hypothetical protein